MKLWSEVFHDSEQYVKLVFDTYYDIDNVEVCVDDTRHVVSSLLAVPYRFRCGDTDNFESCCDRMSKGLYLCGVATEPSHRGKGIMHSIMSDIEKRARENDYDFTFLIPASEILRRLYRKHGYISLPGKVECMVDYCKEGIETDGETIKFTYIGDELNCHVEIEGDKLSVLEGYVERYNVEMLNISEVEFEKFSEENRAVSLKEFDSCMKVDGSGCRESETWCEDRDKLTLLRSCYRFMLERESEDAPLTILQGWRDFIAAVRENNISGGRVVVLQNCDCKPFAIIFCYIEREESCIDIRYAASRSEDCLGLLLLYLKLCCFRDASTAKLSLPVIMDPYHPVISERFSRRAVISTGEGLMTVSVRSGSFCSVSYGMVKWLKSPSRLFPMDNGQGGKEICKSQRLKDSMKFTERSIIESSARKKDCTCTGIDLNTDEIILNSGIIDLNENSSGNYKCNQIDSVPPVNCKTDPNGICLNISLMLD